MADSSNRQKELFLKALDIPSLGERAAFLAKECGDDAALLRRIEAMLDAHAKPDSFLEKPAAELGATVDASLTLARQEPMLTIPPAALLTVAGKPYVYLIADQRAVRRAVEVADSSADKAVIRSGVKNGDQVIVGELGKIKEGTRVIGRAK